MSEAEPFRTRPAGALSARFSRQRRTGTAPELLLRRELHRRGRRFRVHYAIPGLPRRRADIVFTRWRLAIFVDGCFWHACPTHGTLPQTNREWWAWKLAKNTARDRDTDRQLERLGWTVLRIWEHEPTASACDCVESVLEELAG